MDINLKVRVEAPEIMAAILALAESLPQMKWGAALPAKEVQALQPKKEEVKTVALEEVRAKLASLSQAGKQMQVKALIQKFGGSKLTEVATENYEAMLKEAEAI